jgi:hypothetical protein
MLCLASMDFVIKEASVISPQMIKFTHTALVRFSPLQFHPFNCNRLIKNVWAPGASARTGDSAKKRLYRSVSHCRKTQREIKWGITCFELLLGSHSKQNMSAMDFQYLASYQLRQRDSLRSSACCSSSDLHPTCFFLLGYKQLTQNRKAMVTAKFRSSMFTGMENVVQSLSI